MASIRSDISTGRRLYIQTAYGEPIVPALKELGAHWDAQARAWWISPAKRAAVEDLLIGADMAEDAAKVAGAPTPKERPEDIRLVGKARYKGRSYYVRAISAAGDRCRLVSLDQAVDFWTPLAVRGGALVGRPDTRDHDGSGEFAALEKTYEPREERGHYGRGTGRMVHTTLASIQRFIERQKNPDTRRTECTECGSYGPSGERCKDCGGEGMYP